ncbi:hypothetical protein ACMGDK_09530 [Chryseobacterium sp. DT-3]|uniref:hypothetical protein n=1 Tax=Chryseobacterium sp. DT-3 TaxID=3396164 RepID=UPI003F1CB423
MKIVLSKFLTFFSLILYGQNDMDEQLKKLFLDLDLTSNPQVMVSKSSLKFEHIVRQGINWGNAGGNTTNFITKVAKNPFIESHIKDGQISIIQKADEVKSGTFSINEQLWFDNYEDLMQEYRKICSLFEKFGTKVKNKIVEDENFEIKHEITEIFMEKDSEKVTLTIAYHLPPKEMGEKEYFLAIIYTKFQ